MNNPYVFEREPFNAYSEEDHTKRDYPTSFDLDARWAESPSFPNRRGYGLLSEMSSGKNLNCSQVPTDCSFMTREEQRKVRAAGKPEPL
jgi:hypothetical protein